MLGTNGPRLLAGCDGEYPWPANVVIIVSFSFQLKAAAAWKKPLIRG